MPERTCDHYPSFQVSSHHDGAAIIRLNDIFTAQFCPRYLLILIKCCRILCYSGFIDWVDSILDAKQRVHLEKSNVQLYSLGYLTRGRAHKSLSPILTSSTSTPSLNHRATSSILTSLILDIRFFIFPFSSPSVSNVQSSRP